MKRRTLIRNLGVAGIATAAVSGTTTAAEGPSITDLGIRREFDVASIEGQVSLDELLEPDEVAALPADADPTEFSVTVAPEADAITIQDCCLYCCEDELLVCDCICCTCDDCACDNTC